jgi:hypothetical protein
MNQPSKPTILRRSLGSWTRSTSSARKELVGAYIAPILLVRQEVGAGVQIKYGKNHDGYCPGGKKVKVMKDGWYFDKDGQKVITIITYY